MFESFSICCTEVQNQMDIIPELDRCLYQKKIKHYTTTAVEQVEHNISIKRCHYLWRNSYFWWHKSHWIVRWITRTFCRFLILWLHYNFSGCHSGQNIWVDWMNGQNIFVDWMNQILPIDLFKVFYQCWTVDNNPETNDILNWKIPKHLFPST